jgi:hypothetical protein
MFQKDVCVVRMLACTLFIPLLLYRAKSWVRLWNPIERPRREVFDQSVCGYVCMYTHTHTHIYISICCHICLHLQVRLCDTFRECGQGILICMCLLLLAFSLALSLSLSLSLSFSVCVLRAVANWPNNLFDHTACKSWGQYVMCCDLVTRKQHVRCPSLCTWQAMLDLLCRKFYVHVHACAYLIYVYICV